jgi:hypothetical protein
MGSFETSKRSIHSAKGRFIANITVGSLNKNEQSTPYLLAVDKFETTNSSAVSEFF